MSTGINANQLRPLLKRQNKVYIIDNTVGTRVKLSNFNQGKNVEQYGYLLQRPIKELIHKGNILEIHI